MAETPQGLGDPFRKFRAGEPVHSSARRENAIIDVLADVRRVANQHGAGDMVQRSASTGIAWMRNASGADVDRFGILGIAGPPISAAPDESEFCSHLMFTGVTPSTTTPSPHTGKFAILLEPIADGEFGRVLVSGVCQVKLNVLRTDHRYAEVIDGNTTALESADHGSAEILHFEPVSTGNGRWAIVRIGTAQKLTRFFLKTVFAIADFYCTATAYMEYSAQEITVYQNSFAALRKGFVGQFGYAVWNISSSFRRWEVVTLDESEFHGKVQAGYVNTGSPVKVSVKLCAQTGTVVAGSAFDVWFNIPAGQAPALFPDDVISFAFSKSPDAAGFSKPVCTSPCAGLAFDTILPFAGAVGSIPKGWKLCDGTNGTVDLSGRFLMCIDADGQADEDAVGHTGGYRTHGTSENNHGTHNDPSHTVTPTTAAVTPTGAVNALTAATVAHATPDWTHSDTDNRPRYYALAYMQRVE